MNTSSGNGRTTAVFFDVDGTLVKSTIVHYYAYFRKRRLARVVRSIWYASFLVKCLYFLVLDKIDRSLFNVRFYKSYAGLPAAGIKSLAEDCFVDVIKPRLFEHAPACVSAHSRAGRTVVLLTGSIDFIIAPLAKALEADAVIAPTLLESDGLFTGSLNGPPIGDQEKVRKLLEYARANDVDLGASYAYADSIADLPMLEQVGHPNVVNPDKALASVARQRGWPIHQWHLAPSA